DCDMQRWRHIAPLKSSNHLNQFACLRDWIGSSAVPAVRKAQEQVRATHYSGLLDLRPVASKNAVWVDAPVRADDGKTDRPLHLGLHPFWVSVAPDARSVESERDGRDWFAPAGRRTRPGVG